VRRSEGVGVGVGVDERCVQRLGCREGEMKPLLVISD